MKVSICSRKAAHALLQGDFPANTAVISFCDPPSRRTGTAAPPLDYTGKAARVFTVTIHDIDLNVLPDFGLTFDTYFPEADAGSLHHPRPRRRA